MDDDEIVSEEEFFANWLTPSEALARLKAMGRPGAITEIVRRLRAGQLKGAPESISIGAGTYEKPNVVERAVLDIWVWARVADRLLSLTDFWETAGFEVPLDTSWREQYGLADRLRNGRRGAGRAARPGLCARPRLAPHRPEGHPVRKSHLRRPAPEAAIRIMVPLACAINCTYPAACGECRSSRRQAWGAEPVPKPSLKREFVRDVSAHRGLRLWTRRHTRGIASLMNTQSKIVAQREQERHYGLTLMQILTPYLILATVLLAGIVLTTMR